jgi:deoxyribonuclease V
VARTPGLDELKQIQDELARRVEIRTRHGPLRTIGGCDVSYDGNGRMKAVVCLMSYPGLRELEWTLAERDESFPYIPTYLSFREMPVLLEAFSKLERTPDLLLVDGQGIAHPRGLGIASHIGVELDLPALGCAKSHLFGTYIVPGPEKGQFTPLTSGDRVIGAVVRTRDNVKPLFVSPGHRVDVQEGVRICLNSCTKYRNPEPLRRAHYLSRRSIDGRI